MGSLGIYSVASVAPAEFIRGARGIYSVASADSVDSLTTAGNPKSKMPRPAAPRSAEPRNRG